MCLLTPATKTSWLCMSLFILMTFPSAAQKSEKFYDYNWKECEPAMARFYSTIEKTDSGYLHNDYFIHEQKLQMQGLYEDADAKVKNGIFYFYHPNGVLQSVGRYVHGKLDGLYLEFHTNGVLSDSTVYQMGKPNGLSLGWTDEGYLSDSTFLNDDGSGTTVRWFGNGMPSEAGRFSAGMKMHGKWAFYHNNGQVSSLETYNEGKLVQKQYFDERGIEMKDTTNRDHDASFPGGKEAWREYILKKIYFPENYKIVNSDKAVVVVTFIIGENGDIVEAFASTPFYPAFDRIAEKAVKGSPKWIPAVSHNRKVKMYMRQPVTFGQEE
jgi:antitoxin component YwqK of YwqJK toxin-antitoxin module